MLTHVGAEIGIHWIIGNLGVEGGALERSVFTSKTSVAAPV